ncbi:molybdate ABC transporter substrate-binding protein [Aquisalimonas asiatica]|uniref:Molybdate transport system substrate-binding protein n=1 Tax=Aquisalimonas asiatica TaxID=406100 RepID=A0A1H8TI67_9GAMM|nr:molybdate ABC transporter substrate-binding protein [Aquisalimonas asiatica]SEO90622.1 molybdate transport system substrate-binding protein [Aquisalimonas asiatica]
MAMHRPAVTLLVCLAVALAGFAPAASQADRPIIAAASDLQFALEEVAERFHDETGRSVRLNFGSSGNFRRQIAQGAPFELYLSADEEYVFALERDGHTEDEGTLYAIGRIVVIAPAGDPADIVDGSLDKLAERLEAGDITRFAIANPDHAPYGVAAMEALQSKGLWQTVRPRLIQGENVSQAARLALSGEAQGGIVAYSLARAPGIAARSDHALIPEEAHTPLRQRMALVDGAGETARMFYAYLQEEPARNILEDFGFALPDD